MFMPTGDDKSRLHHNRPEAALRPFDLREGTNVHSRASHEAPGSRKSSDSRTALHRQFSSQWNRPFPSWHEGRFCARKKDKYTRRRLEEGVGKASWNPGQFRPVLLRMGTPSGVLPLKIVSQCREQAGKVYNVAVFEIEQETPIQIGLVLWGGGGIAVQRRGRA